MIQYAVAFLGLVAFAFVIGAAFALYAWDLLTEVVVPALTRDRS